MGVFEVTATPYIHKSFFSKGGEVEPFFAFPFGMAFANSTYNWVSQAVIGGIFKGGEHFRYTMELGINVNRAETYLAGGVTYYH